MTECYQWNISYFFKSRNARCIKFVSLTLSVIEKSLYYWLACLLYSLFPYLPFIGLYSFISPRLKIFSVTKFIPSSNVVEFNCTLKTKLLFEEVNSWWHHRSIGSLHSTVFWKIQSVVSVASFMSAVYILLVKYSKIVSEYDQEIPQSQTADNPLAPRGRAAQPSRDTRKTN